jgi:hypothetical protein
MVLLSGVELSDPSLQVDLGLFQHASMAGVGAAFELFGNPSEGEAQVFFFAQLSRLFACQARLSRRNRGSRIFLLGLDRLALPASSHGPDYSRPNRPSTLQVASVFKTEPIGKQTRGAEGKSEAEKLPQPFGLSAADGNLALLLVIHAQLIRALEPGHNFANSIDVHQVGAMSAPEQALVQTGE